MTSSPFWIVQWSQTSVWLTQACPMNIKKVKSIHLQNFYSMWLDLESHGHDYSMEWARKWTSKLTEFPSTRNHLHVTWVTQYSLVPQVHHMHPADDHQYCRFAVMDELVTLGLTDRCYCYKLWIWGCQPNYHGRPTVQKWTLMQWLL